MRIMETTITDRSVVVMPFIVIGLMSPVTPKMARMLKTLDPKTLPMAIPLFPFRADTTLVASSGSDVPPATIVSPMTASDTPSCAATCVAPSTKRLLPPIRHAKPMMIHTADMVADIGFFSVFMSEDSSCSSVLLLFAPCKVIYMKAMNITKSVAASSRLICPSRHMIINTIEATNAKGMSLLIVTLVIAMGATIADTPTINRALKMFEPTMFPTAKSGVPLRADTRLTQNSGMLVPIATIVNPITICGIFSFSATATAPSVSRSAPHKTRLIPTRIKTMFRSIISYLIFVWRQSYEEKLNSCVSFGFLFSAEDSSSCIYMRWKECVCVL